MAHSAENFTTLDAILARYDPQEVRYFLLATHYRSSLSFNVDESGVRGIEDARAALARLRRALGPERLDRNGPLDQPTVDRFIAAMDADFNTPDALAVVFDLAREVNTRRTSGAEDLQLLRRTLVHLLDILGLDLTAEAASQDGQSIEPFVGLLLDLRKELREAKQWALADSVRDRLKDLGVVVEDKPGGTSSWRLER
jgi:cysteinyl-tRNA synthetase